MRSMIRTLLPALLLASPGAAAPTAEAPAKEKAVTVTVRGAPLSDVVARAAEATGVRMATAGPVGDQRVTLSAPRTTATELRAGLRDLLWLRETRRAGEAGERFVLSLDPQHAGRAEAWQLRQTDTLIRSVVRTAEAFAMGRDAEASRAVVERFRKEHPEFPESSLTPLTTDYLRQSMLLTVLPATARGQLVQSGWISLPLAWLAPADQALLATFAQGGSGRAALASPWQSGVTAARAQYRLLYGDRWTDQVLLAQVGSPGAWSSATLPSILFRQRDGSSLYPDSAIMPNDADVWRRLPPRFDVAGKDWDTALTAIAAEMKIRLAADSYSRPWLYQTGRSLPSVAGLTLKEALDRLCAERGYFWWKQGGWYLLRSRTWVDESRVAVPDRLLATCTDSIRRSGELAADDLLQLAALSDEQLLTVNLLARAPGEVRFLSDAFDPDAAALLANALLLFQGLPTAQREMALSGELPALWMPPAQQNLFAAVAAQSGTPLLGEEAETWSFRFRQEFGAAAGVRPAGAANAPVNGRLTVEWRFGPAEVVRASLLLSDRALHRKVDGANPSPAR